MGNGWENYCGAAGKSGVLNGWENYYGAAGKSGVLNGWEDYQLSVDN